MPAQEQKILDKKMFMAAKNGNSEKVEQLISQGAKINQKDKFGDTPLHLTTEAGHIDVIKILLKNKANIDAKNYNGNTSLHLAAQAGYIDAVKILLKNKANIEAKNDLGNTPLHLAAQAGYIDVVKILITNKADINARDREGNTALHFAVCAGNDFRYACYDEIININIDIYINIIKEFIMGRANINAKNNDGNTPLHFAVISADQMVSFDKTKLINFLIKNGADGNLINKDQKTPLELAVKVENHLYTNKIVALLFCHTTLFVEDGQSNYKELWKKFFLQTAKIIEYETEITQKVKANKISDLKDNIISNFRFLPRPIIKNSSNSNNIIDLDNTHSLLQNSNLVKL